jgi:glycine dehydrogenase
VARSPKFYVSDKCHPQTIEVVKTRAEGLGLEAVVGDENSFDYTAKDVCGVLVQYPATDGAVIDYKPIVQKAHARRHSRRRRRRLALPHRAPTAG